MHLYNDLPKKDFFLNLVFLFLRIISYLITDPYCDWVTFCFPSQNFLPLNPVLPLLCLGAPGLSGWPARRKTPNQEISVVKALSCTASFCSQKDGQPYPSKWHWQVLCAEGTITLSKNTNTACYQKRKRMCSFPGLSSSHTRKAKEMIYEWFQWG